MNVFFPRKIQDIISLHCECIYIQLFQCYSADYCTCVSTEKGNGREWNASEITR